MVTILTKWRNGKAMGERGLKDESLAAVVYALCQSTTSPLCDFGAILIASGGVYRVFSGCVASRYDLMTLMFSTLAAWIHA